MQFPQNIYSLMNTFVVYLKYKNFILYTYKKVKFPKK